MTTYTDGLAPTPAARAAAPEVGPNAITQLIGPLRAAGGPALLHQVFHHAALDDTLADPPRGMVPETDARRLFQAVLVHLSAELATGVLAAAGRGTAEYVIQHRIPGPVRWLLPRLPARMASALLLGAIERHAWTFAGSGRCTTASDGGEVLVTIRDNPLATPGCPWHTAVFSRMFQRLVAPAAHVRHGRCEAHGEPACRFVVGFD